MVRDTRLESLKVNGRDLASFSPHVLDYNALVPAGVDAVPTVQATASDPAASVVIEQAPTPTGQARVTVTSDGASSVYTINLNTPITGSDEFDPGGLGSQWKWVREDDARWRLGDGSLVITSQAGDLQGNSNTARNVALQEVNGDWTADSKLVFSRPLAANNEQGGIIAYADDDNYVKLAWEMANASAAMNKLRVAVIREQNGAAATLEITGSDAQRIVGTDGAIWLRLKKTGSTYRAYYSNDGSVYRFIGSTTLSTEATQAGLVAFNRGGTSTDLDVAFDHFRISSHGDPVPPPQPELSIQGLPRVVKVTPRQELARLRLRATNTGYAASGPVSLCVEAPRKRLRLEGARCIARDIPVGQTRGRTAKLRVKPRARGETTTVKLIARGPEVATRRATVRVRVAK
jgi:alpha-glucuronidase